MIHWEECLKRARQRDGVKEPQSKAEQKATKKANAVKNRAGGKGKKMSVQFPNAVI